MINRLNKSISTSKPKIRLASILISKLSDKFIIYSQNHIDFFNIQYMGNNFMEHTFMDHFMFHEIPIAVNIQRDLLDRIS